MDADAKRAELAAEYRRWYEGRKDDAELLERIQQFLANPAAQALIAKYNEACRREPKE